MFPCHQDKFNTLFFKVSPASLHSNAPKKIHKLPFTLPIIL